MSFGRKSMSRIGLKPISVPTGVTVSVSPDNIVSVKGPKGDLSQKIHPDIKVEQEDGRLKVVRPSEDTLHRSQHGLARTLINNMVVGVSEGFEVVLEVHGVGYRAQVEGDELVLNIGFSHPVRIKARPGIKFETGQEERSRIIQIKVQGIDKQLVGQSAADIRSIRPPDPYKGKGIRYKGEVVKLKQGKRATA